MTESEPISLDPESEVAEEGPPFPEIPAWVVSDQYSGTELSVEITEGGAQLKISCGDLKHGSYQVMRIDVDSAQLARLAQVHIAPFLEWEDREEVHRATQSEQEEARRRSSADAKAWVIRYSSASRPGWTQNKVHRNGCPVVIKEDLHSSTGAHTHGGTHDGAGFLAILDQVEIQLQALIGKDQVNAKLHRIRLAEAGRVRGTRMDYRPLVMCLRCKPLGDQTAELMETLTALAETTERTYQQDCRLIDLMTTMRNLVWVEEQAHLDKLRSI